MSWVFSANSHSPELEGLRSRCKELRTLPLMQFVIFKVGTNFLSWEENKSNGRGTFLLSFTTRRWWVACPDRIYCTNLHSRTQKETLQTNTHPRLVQIIWGAESQQKQQRLSIRTKNSLQINKQRSEFLLQLEIKSCDIMRRQSSLPLLSLLLLVFVKIA